MDYTVPPLPHIFCGWSSVSRIHRSLLLQHRSFESSILKLWVTLNSGLRMLVTNLEVVVNLMEQTGMEECEWESLAEWYSVTNKLETIVRKWRNRFWNVLARAGFFQASCYLQCRWVYLVFAGDCFIIVLFFLKSGNATVYFKVFWNRFD